MTRLVLATLATLLLLPALARADWLAPVGDGDVSKSSLEPRGSVLLPSGDLVVLHSHNAQGGLTVATHPAGGPFGAPLVLTPEVTSTPPQLRATSQAIAAGADGSVTAAWVELDQINGPQRVLTETRSPGGLWGTPQVARPASLTGASDVATATTTAGDVLVAWTESGGLWLARRPAGAPAFTAPVQVASANATSPRLAAGGPVAVLAWLDTAARSVRAASVATAVGAPATVTTAPTGQSLDSLALGADATGRVTLGWVRRNASPEVVEAAVRAPDGTLSAVDTVSDASSAPVNQATADTDLAVAGPGAAVFAWDHNGQVFAARAAGGQPFGDPAGLGQSGGGAATPAVGIDDSGTATAVWVDGNRLLGARAPGGGNWSAASTIAAEYPPDRYIVSPRPDLAVAPGGDAAAVYANIAPSNGSVTSALVVPFDANPPRQSGVSVPATAITGQRVTFSISATDVWSAAQTTWHVTDDSSDTVGATVRHDFLDPGTYAVTATSTDASGHAVTSAPRTVTATAPPAPGPTASASPAPAGTATPTPTPTATAMPTRKVTFTLRGTAGKRRTRVRSLVVSDVPAGAKVRLSCAPRKRCPFAKRTLKVTKGHARLGTTTFRAGTTLTVRVGTTTKRYRFLKGRLP